MKKCIVENCTNLSICKQLCTKHYARLRSSGNPNLTPSGKEHGKRKQCVVNDCDRTWDSRQGWCTMHYKRWKRTGTLITTLNRGSKRYEKDGYVLVYFPEHPNSQSGGYVREHRYVMSNHLNRPLNEYEVVHHRNGIRDDNRIENLELLTRHTHPTAHDIICPNCGIKFDSNQLSRLDESLDWLEY